MDLPTTNDMLNIEINEITPLLKQLGLTGQDGPMNSQKTRKVVVQQVDIRIDGNLPIILNSELFKMINEARNEDKIKTNYQADNADDEENEFDPNLPLYEQFSTIKEFAPPIKDERKLVPWNYSKSESLQSTTTTSEADSWPSTSVSDVSSTYSSSITTTTYSEGEEDSNDEMFEPLLKKDQPLYTPRQLYQRKKLQEAFQKVSSQTFF